MTRPDIRELECFLAVAEQLNFSRAARQLHLSQPPLTRHIQSLEHKLGSRLLERNTHAVALTGAGRLFLEDARSILGLLDRSADAVRRSRAGETARLRLAFVGALLDERLVRLVQRFRRSHPHCQVQAADLPPAAQIEALRAGLLDGAFIGAQPAREPRGVAFATWAREPLVLAVPETHPLATARTLRWPDLRELAWVMVSSDAAPAFRRQFSDLSRRHRLRPRVVQESERLPAIITMVATGGGVTMVPKSAARLISTGIVFRDLPPPRPALRHTFAYSTRAKSAPLGDFLALLRAM